MSRRRMAPRPQHRPLSDVLAGKDVVAAAPDGSSITVVERPRHALQESQEQPRARDFRELGSTGTSSWQYYDRFEYLDELRGHESYRTYDKMRRGDGQVRKTLRLIKTPVVSGKWLVKPASEDEQDQEIAEFVWACLNEFMTTSFRQVLTDALLMLDYGHAVLEKVWETKETRFGTKHVWRKLAPRHPADEYQWEFDAHGGPNGVWMWKPDQAVGSLGLIAQRRTTASTSAPGGQPYVWLPIRKVLVFTNDKEVGNIIGMSVLRSAYKHWYMKDKLYLIDAIQKERHGIGIPVIQLPTAFNEEDRRLADEIGRNLRVNESAHVVLPPGWILEYAEISGNPVDCLTSIEHHNEMISATILGDFFGDANEVSRDIFLQSARFVADALSDAFNHYAIPQLVDFNYDVDAYPKLMVKHIGDTVDQQKFSFGVRNLVGADLLRADEPLEDYLRELWELPARDPNSDRKLEQMEFEAEQKQQEAEMQAEQQEMDRQFQAQQGDADRKASEQQAKLRTAQAGPANGQQRSARAGLPRQGRPSAKPPKRNTGAASNNPATTRSSPGPSR